MKKLFLVNAFFIAVSVSCTPGVKKVEEGVLHGVFNQYSLVSHESDSIQAKYFTENMWKTLTESRSNPTNSSDASVNAINNFPNELIVENSMESQNNGKGCLIVQGVNQDKSAVDYVIEFNLLNGRWVMSDISVTLYDPDQKRWLTEPICDTEKQQLFWFNTQQQE